MNNKEFGPSLFLFVCCFCFFYSFLWCVVARLLDCSHAASIFLRLSLAAVLLTEKLDKTTEEDKERGRDSNDGPQWETLYSIHYVFINIVDVFDPPS